MRRKSVFFIFVGLAAIRITNSLDSAAVWTLISPNFKKVEIIPFVTTDISSTLSKLTVDTSRWKNPFKEKAAKLKKQLGIRLGKIVNYQEGGYCPPIYLRAEALSLDKSGGVGGPEVPPGENEIVVNITITYQIK